ncbi:hypothetical protein, partial [Tenacibaculum aiptasiae]|uniref:hypothetical protein n=1 Tax=Tenacibaculum aiptasiae TaxID=426481 RepID=UPI00158827B1
MKEKRYLLDVATTLKLDKEIEITPSLDGENVKQKELFFDLPKDVNSVYENDFEFDYLIPRYSDEYKRVGFLCDLHSWVGEEPDFFYGYPVSK